MKFKKGPSLNDVIFKFGSFDITLRKPVRPATSVLTTKSIADFNQRISEGERDFGGDYFVWGDSDVSNEVEIDTSIDTYDNPITNANFIIGVERTPTVVESSVVEFDWEPEFLREGDFGMPSAFGTTSGVATHTTWQPPVMWDPFSDIQTRPPQLSHWPPQPDELDSSYTVNNNWIPIQVVNDLFDVFGVSGDQGQFIENGDGDVYGFTVTEDYAKNLIKQGLNLECDRREIAQTPENRKLIMEGTQNGDGTTAPYYDILPTGIMLWGLANSILTSFIVSYDEKEDGNIDILFQDSTEGISTGYLHFCLFGQGAWLLDKPHSFTLDLANKKILYRHNQTTPPPQVFATKPKTSDLSVGSNGGFLTRADTAVENCSFTFTLNDYNSYLFRNANSASKLKMNNCRVRFPYRAGALSKDFQFVDSELLWAIQRGFSTGREGCLIKRSIFTGCEQSSATSYINGNQETDDPADGWGPWVVEECIYNLLYSNHGQGISSYQGSWINWTIRNNIFLNCQRAASLQGTPGAWSDDGTLTAGANWQDLSGFTYSGYIFENNLICHTQNLTIPNTGGQWGHAWNGSINTDLFDSRQAKARITNNTYIIAPHVEEEGWRTDYGLRTYVGLQMSEDLGVSADALHPEFEFTVEGNLGLFKQYRDDAIHEGSDKNLFSDENLWLKPDELVTDLTYSSTDLFVPLDPNTNEDFSYPDSLYYLYDNGEADKKDWVPVVRNDVSQKYQNIGIQWENPPTFRELETLDKTWSSGITFNQPPEHAGGTLEGENIDSRPYTISLLAEGSGEFVGPDENNDYSVTGLTYTNNLFDPTRANTVWAYDSDVAENKYNIRVWLDTSDDGLLFNLYGPEPDPTAPDWVPDDRRAGRLESENYVKIYYNDNLVAEKSQFGGADNQVEYATLIGSSFYTYYRDDDITSHIIGPTAGDIFTVQFSSVEPDRTGY